MSSSIINEELKQAMKQLTKATIKAVDSREEPNQLGKWSAKRTKLYANQKENFMSCSLGQHKGRMDEIISMLDRLLNIECSKSVIVARMIDLFHDHLVQLITKTMGMSDTKAALDIFLDSIGDERLALYSAAGKTPK
jgi:ERCC4-related helicase